MTNEILIRSGNSFVPFMGIRETVAKETIEIVFVLDGSLDVTDCEVLECTPEHRLMTPTGEWLFAGDVVEGTQLLHDDGVAVVVFTELHSEPTVVYDPLECGSEHSYTANKLKNHNCVLLDEFAFVPRNIQELFFRSTLPVISSGKTTKIIMVSTPNGMEMFYKIWTEADPNSDSPNGYARCQATWQEMPGRDEAWRAAEERRLGPDGFRQEYGGEFLGSQNTLIESTKIAGLAFIKPIRITCDSRVKIYAEPIAGHIYCICVDSAYGKGGDYSAFVVFDVTVFPYTQVAVFRDNRTNYLVYPDVIAHVANAYNEAVILCEVNDVGLLVAEALTQDLEYENVLSVRSTGRAQEISSGFSKNAQPGIKMSPSTKRVGCASLKTVVEKDQLIVNDFDTIAELSTFVSVGKSFEADAGATDDIVMCLVIFSWLLNQSYFKELTSNSIRGVIHERFSESDFEELTPFGIIDDGVADYEEDDGAKFIKGYPRNTLQ